MIILLLLSLSLVCHTSLAADPSAQHISVSTLLSTGTWTPLSPGAVASGQCKPKHWFCKRFLNAKKIELSNGVSSVNFGMIETNADGSNPQLRYSIHLNDTSGVKRIHARTGPRSRGDKNLQQALWACPFVPELQIELDPRGGDIKLLEGVFMQVIVYFTACDLDVANGESVLDHVLIGHENKFTTQMKLSPAYQYPIQYNPNLYGAQALYINLNQVTPGNNNLMVTRGNKENIAASFNAMQGNSDQYIHQNTTWTYPLLFILIFLVLITLIFSAIGFFNSDKATTVALAETRTLSAQMANITKILNVVVDKELTHEAPHPNVRKRNVSREVSHFADHEYQ